MSALFDQIASFENILSAAKTAARGKRYRMSTASFLMRLESECLALSQELQSGAWRPGPYRVFEIREPKLRTICAAPFRDRVVHQALVQVIEPRFERGFIADSYSCRIGKGTHAALARVERWAHRYPWALKVDVEKFFPSVDHEVALNALAQRIACRRTMSLCRAILSSWTSGEAPLRWFRGDDLFTPLERSRGIPIGNLTSQFLSNVVLDAVDHEVKDRLRVRAYARYCDDMVAFGDTVAELRAVEVAIENALEARRLSANRRKSHIFPTAQGVPCVGFLVGPANTRVRREAIARVRRRFRAFANRALPAAAAASIAAWRGHAAHGLARARREALESLACASISPTIRPVTSGNASILPEVLRRVVEAYRPVGVYLFGSEARGDAGEDSDIDLAVIVPDDALPERASPRAAAEALWGLDRGADVVVFRESEFAARCSVVASLPWTIRREGRLLYGGR
ncbi:MAG: reverse transcriptase domain-containing protein [Planctomycetota bacterium]|nr:reverse transcriptase domain-containing protein [Planctomycetota bacterium]